MIWSSSVQMTLAKGRGVKFFCWLLTRAHHNQQIILCSQSASGRWIQYECMITFLFTNQPDCLKTAQSNARQKWVPADQSRIDHENLESWRHLSAINPNIYQIRSNHTHRSSCRVVKYGKDHPSNWIFFTHPVFHGDLGTNPSYPNF